MSVRYAFRYLIGPAQGGQLQDIAASQRVFAAGQHALYKINDIAHDIEPVRAETEFQPAVHAV